MASKNFDKPVRISQVVSVNDLINEYAFVEGVIYINKDAPKGSRYRYYTPLSTSNGYVSDCYPCDIRGNTSKWHETVLASDIGKPVRHNLKRITNLI